MNVALYAVAMKFPDAGVMEVTVLQRSRHRFEWILCNWEGVRVAGGEARTVAQARLDALRAHNQQRPPGDPDE
jgi:hypothetical protein